MIMRYNYLFYVDRGGIMLYFKTIYFRSILCLFSQVVFILSMLLGGVWLAVF